MIGGTSAYKERQSDIHSGNGDISNLISDISKHLVISETI